MLELLKKYRTTLVSACLILTALLFYSANLRQREKTTLFEKAVLQVTAPMQKFIDLVWEGVANTWNHYLWLVDTQVENERLAEENSWLKSELQQLEEVRLANGRLQRLLEFKEEVGLSTLPAQVIAEDTSSWFRTVVIDKGTRDGVVEGLPVVVAEGAVGRVIKSAPHESRVLLVTDGSSAVASLVQRTRTRGVSRGQGDRMVLDYVLRQEDVQEGDLIITSGMGGVFPKGIPIGEVKRVLKGEYGLFQSVEVASAVDFSRLEEVLVLLKEN